MTVVEFLLARIAEDEKRALTAAGWDRSGRERSSGRWLRTGISSLEDDEQRPVIYSDNNQLSETVADHIARHDPARVLAECKAKRRIVELAGEAVADWQESDPPPLRGEIGPGEQILRVLASVYADHPDYVAAWR